MISDVVSVIMHAYSVIYGSVMILAHLFCVLCVALFVLSEKKQDAAGKYTAFQSSDQIDSWLFCCHHVCRCSYFLEKPVVCIWEETVILQENKKEPVKDTSIVYISNCFVGSDMTAHAFDSLVEKVKRK